MYFKMGCLCTIVSRYSERKELWTAQIYKYFETALLDMLHAEKCIAKKSSIITSIFARGKRYRWFVLDEDWVGL